MKDTTQQQFQQKSTTETTISTKKNMTQIHKPKNQAIETRKKPSLFFQKNYINLPSQKNINFQIT